MATGFSFEAVNAADYDDLRPDYAPEAVAWVAERAGLGPGSLVVDLAAGTGQLSRRFALLGVELLAVEPARNMRAVLEERLPAVRAVDGSAEAIPLGDGEADAVVVGNAFHHFDRDRALVEIRRVLHPGGALALFWAREDDAARDRYPPLRTLEEAVAEMRERSPIMHAYRGAADAPATLEGFSPVERRSFPTTHHIDSARLADLYATSSDVASLPAGERSALLGRIAEIARELPPTLELPARSDVDLVVRGA